MGASVTWSKVDLEVFQRRLWSTSHILFLLAQGRIENIRGAAPRKCWIKSDDDDFSGRLPWEWYWRSATKDMNIDRSLKSGWPLRGTAVEGSAVKMRGEFWSKFSSQKVVKEMQRRVGDELQCAAQVCRWADVRRREGSWYARPRLT